MSLNTAIRHVAGVTVVDLSGRLVLGGGERQLSNVITPLLERGERKLLLNLEELSYIDSMGLGELVSSYASTARLGGVLKLLRPGQRVRDLLKITHLDSLFEIWDDEQAAAMSFNAASEARTQQALGEFLR